MSVADVVIEVMNQRANLKRTVVQTEKPVVNASEISQPSSPKFIPSSATLSGPGQTSIIDLVLIPHKPGAPHETALVHSNSKSHLQHTPTSSATSLKEPVRERRSSTSTVRSTPPSASQESLSSEDDWEVSVSPPKEKKSLSNVLHNSSVYHAVHDAFQSVLGTEKKSIGKLVDVSAKTFTAVPTSSTKSRLRHS
ncbi:hypothetical protein VNI00_013317 [Paramarasmius palmivorus]|uniref:Uncharacterized protein n=1 Tax=Paramarasmius palmivorus TaxID=297713 RepID=A0AAW0C2D9_9AGAR